MKEFYLINVIGNIQNVSMLLLIIFGLLSVIFGLCYCIEKASYGDEYDLKPVKKFIHISSIIVSICVLVMIFVPSKKELYWIYGGGTVLEYVQNNEDMQKLPDKAVKALNVYFDKYVDNNDSSGN